jgi:hypothetical protein
LRRDQITQSWVEQVGTGRKQRGKLADMAVRPPTERYTPPPESACEVDEGPIEVDVSSRLELLTIEAGGTPSADSDQPIRTGVNTTVGMMLDASTRIAFPQQWDAFNVTGRFTPTLA